MTAEFDPGFNLLVRAVQLRSYNAFARLSALSASHYCEAIHAAVSINN